jgi:protein-tyrosine-phosphatase
MNVTENVSTGAPWGAGGGRLVARRGAAAGDVSATPDLLAMPEVVAAATTPGLDLDAHRSRRLDAGIVAASDLILTMTRAQADAIGVLHDDVHGLLFLIGELAGLVGDDSPWQASAPLDGRLPERLGSLHLRRGLRGLRDADDVPDPIGHGQEALVLALRCALALTAHGSGRASPEIVDAQGWHHPRDGDDVFLNIPDRATPDIRPQRRKVDPVARPVQRSSLDLIVKRSPQTFTHAMPLPFVRRVRLHHPYARAGSDCDAGGIARPPVFPQQGRRSAQHAFHESPVGEWVAMNDAVRSGPRLPGRHALPHVTVPEEAQHVRLRIAGQP